MQGALREHDQSAHYSPIVEEEEQDSIKPDDERATGVTQEASGSPHSRLLIEEPLNRSGVKASPLAGRLKVRETLKLSFEFCILWVGVLSTQTKAG